MKENIENNAITESFMHNDPVFRIKEQEFDMNLLRFGSLVSILKNKRINQTMLFSTLLDSEDFRDCFSSICEVDEMRILLYNYITRFPILYKSKIIKNKIKELSYDRSRKKII